jgi:hypothetical protein
MNTHPSHPKSMGPWLPKVLLRRFRGTALKVAGQLNCGGFARVSWAFASMAEAQGGGMPGWRSQGTFIHGDKINRRNGEYNYSSRSSSKWRNMNKCIYFIVPNWRDTSVSISGLGSGALFFFCRAQKPERNRSAGTVERWNLGTCCWGAKLGLW